jgi:hypothetical protein
VFPQGTPNANTIVSLNDTGNASSGPSLYVQVFSAGLSAVGWFANVQGKGFSPAASAGNTIKVAGTFATSGTLASVTTQGQAVATSAASTWNGTSNRLQIGAIDGSGTQAANFIIQSVVYIPTYSTAQAISRTA